MSSNGTNYWSAEKTPDSTCCTRPYMVTSPFQQPTCAAQFDRLDTPTSQHSPTYLAEQTLINTPSFQEMWSTGTPFQSQLVISHQWNLLAEPCNTRAGRHLLLTSLAMALQQ